MNIACSSNTTIKNNNEEKNNQTFNDGNEFYDAGQTYRINVFKKTTETIQPIIVALIQKGMSANKFYPRVWGTLDILRVAGATVEYFIQGYDIAERLAKNHEIDINFIIEVVIDLLGESKATRNDKVC